MRGRQGAYPKETWRRRGSALRPAPHKDGSGKAPVLIGAGRESWAALIGGEQGRGGAGQGRFTRAKGLACCGIKTMWWAQRHLRAALSLAAVSARSATTEVAARRGLSAWPAPQEPGMEYQVAFRRSAMTRGPGLSDTASGLRQLKGEPGA
jgi:hypothetical protein